MTCFPRSHHNYIEGNIKLCANKEASDSSANVVQVIQTLKSESSPSVVVYNTPLDRGRVEDKPKTAAYSKLNIPAVEDFASDEFVNAVMAIQTTSINGGDAPDPPKKKRRFLQSDTPDGTLKCNLYSQANISLESALCIEGPDRRSPDIIYYSPPATLLQNSMHESDQEVVAECRVSATLQREVFNGKKSMDSTQTDVNPGVNGVLQIFGQHIWKIFSPNATTCE